MKLVRALAAALVLSLLLLPSVVLAQGQVTIEVDAGFDGYYSREAGATPVRVRVTNPSRGFTARVELESYLESGKVLHFADVELPQGSQKLVTLYPANTGLNVAANVRVLDGKREVAKGTDKLTSVDAGTRLYGVLGSDLAGYSGLVVPGSGPSAFLARLSPETLPNRADAVSSLTALVVDGTDTATLTDAQKTALRGWVQLGGKLVIAGGADAARNAAGLADLLPVRLGATQNARDLSSLRTLAGAKSTPAGGLINRATPLQGATVAANSPEGPLVVSRTAGKGAVHWLAWSPSAEPFKAWEGTTPLLRNLGAPSSVPTLSDTVGANSWVLSQFLQNVAGGRLPPTLLVAAFLIIYSLILGPVLYFILRRQDRRELAWALVPAVTVVFTLIAYGANFFIRGSGAAMRTLEIAETYTGADAGQVITYGSLFSPSRREYDIAMPPHYSLVGRPNSEFFGGPFGSDQPQPQSDLLYRVQAGEQTLLRDLNVDIYSFGQWTARHIQTGQPAMLVADLSGDGASISGQVTNRSGGTLEQVQVLHGARLYDVGTLGPGESQSVSGAGDEMFGGVEFDGDPANQRRNLVRNLFENFGPDGRPRAVTADEALVLAWQAGAQSPMRVTNADVNSSHDRLVVLHSPYSLKTGAVQLPLRPVSVSGDGSTGPVELQYRLPGGVTAEKLTLEIGPPEMGAMQEEFFNGPGDSGVIVEGGQVVPTSGVPVEEDMLGATPVAADSEVFVPGPGLTVRKIEVKDRKTGDWIRVSARNEEFAAIADVQNAARYVDKDGTILMRIEIDGGGIDTSFYRLTVNGRKQ